MQKLAENVELSPDNSLIEGILGGDIALFEVLIRRYNSVLYKIVRSYGFNHQDAEDLMQDAHVSAYTSLKSFKGWSSYKTWISRILINKCLYKLKYGSFKNEIPSDNLPEPNNRFMSSQSKQGETEDRLLNRELTAILEKKSSEYPGELPDRFCIKRDRGIFCGRDSRTFRHQFCERESAVEQGKSTSPKTN